MRPSIPMSSRRLSRREALAAASAAGLGAALVAAGCGGDRPSASTTTTAPSDGSTTNAAADCVLTPEQTEGPYYVAESMVRRDITEDREGVPLGLDLTVQHADSCEPIPGATVEVWHCDALGAYSGVQGVEGMFLRGAQRTGADGRARFDTVYPGWYQGRTTHIHVKVHVAGSEVHTGQLYFDDATTAEIAARAPYEQRGEPDVTNTSDGIYAAGGDASTLRLTRDAGGYVGRLTLGVRA